MTNIKTKSIQSQPFQSSVFCFLSSVFFDIAFLVFGIAYLPIFVMKIKQADSRSRLLRERLGFLPDSFAAANRAKKRVWLHAVSVGEVMAMKHFVEEFLRRTSDYDLVITTVTPTGQKVAKQLEGERVQVCYYPFDWTFAVRRFFSTLQPSCVLLAETEIWPNLLMEAERCNIPVGVINGRLSARSERRYSRFKNLFRPVFQRLDFVLAQAPGDAQRFVQLGADPDTVEVLGNMKFDNVAISNFEEPAKSSLKRQWGFDPEARIWIAGSTHPGEEEIMAHAFCQLYERFPDLKLVLAPRHIERAEAIGQMLSHYGFEVRFATVPERVGDFDVLILNKIGILKNLYVMADVVYMGGSLVPKGGQNPIEPASVRCPIIHGPYVFNFEGVYQALYHGNAALMVRDENQLVFALRRLLENKKESQDLGENAFQIIRQLQGATGRHLVWLLKYLVSEPLERKSDAELNSKLFPSAGRRT